MALVIADRVLETTAVAGTGAATLLGAQTGYQSFSSRLANGDTTWYTIQAKNPDGSLGDDWEVGIGTYSADTLTRDTVLESSNGDALVYFASGNKDIFIDLPSEKLITTAGTGLSISGNTITNTAPDQTVVLTGAGTTTVTGTYPSFTITSTGGAGGGDVLGPLSATDNAITRFDGTTGKIIQNSVATLDDAGVLSTAKELIGPSASANFTRFPNALSVISDTASSIQQNESLYIGTMSEAVSVGTTWATGVYGYGYTNSTGNGRGTGVTGESHVSAATDTGVCVGVRGYAKDVHTGNYNIGLYGDAENGDASLTYQGNVALFLANGNIVTSSAAAKQWYLGGNLTFNGQGSAKTIGVTNGAVFALGTPSSGTLTNCTGLPNAGLVNSSITINGTSTALGGSISVGTVTSVTATSPVTSTGGATPVIAMPAATTSVSGYLTSTDWNTFNSKGSGTVTSVGGTGTVNGITLTGTVTSTGNLTLGGTLSGIGNSQLTNSSVTVNGTAISLGASGTITANTTNALTIGTGLSLSSGTTFNGSAAVTVTNSAPMIYPGAGIAVSTGSAWTTSLTAPSGAIVGTTDTQTLSGKTITGTKETVYTITDGAAFEIDPANGGIQTITLGASRTPAATNFTAGQSVTLMINDGTAYTITWTTVGVVWVGGTAPVLATTGYTVVELWKVSSTIYGAYVGAVA